MRYPKRLLSPERNCIREEEGCGSFIIGFHHMYISCPAWFASWQTQLKDGSILPSHNKQRRKSSDISNRPKSSTSPSLVETLACTTKNSGNYYAVGTRSLRRYLEPFNRSKKRHGDTNSLIGSSFSQNPQKLSKPLVRGDATLGLSNFTISRRETYEIFNTKHLARG